jgi:transposase-like protein
MNADENRQPEGLSANAKRAAVLRVARGETPSEVARSLGITAPELMAWVRKYEQALQNAADNPDEAGLAALHETRFAHSGRGPSMAEMDHPELLEKVDEHFYKPLTEEEDHDNIIRQAVAQEKVGYEKHAPKFFLPESEDPYPEGRNVEQVDMFIAREINRPLLIAGGMMFGLTAGIALAKTGLEIGLPSWWVTGIAGGVSIVLILIGSR